MKFLITSLLVSYCCIFQITAQNFPMAKGLALGNQSINLQAEAILFGNPALLTQLSKDYLVIDIHNRFTINGLNQYSIAYNHHLEQSGYALQLTQFGFDQFKHSQFSFAYGKKLFEQFEIGLKGAYHHLNINEIKAKQALNISLGLSTTVNKDLQINALLSYPILLSDLSSNFLQAKLSFGLAYQLNPLLRCSLEIEKPENNPNSFRFGLDYKYHPRISFQIGFDHQPSSFGFGIQSILNKKTKLQLATSYDIRLGFSPSISFSRQL